LEIKREIGGRTAFLVLFGLSADFGFGLTSSINESDSGFFATAVFSPDSEGLLAEVEASLAASLPKELGAGFSAGRGLFSLFLGAAAL
jgi:hypothetical protein